MSLFNTHMCVYMRVPIIGADTCWYVLLLLHLCCGVEYMAVALRSVATHALLVLTVSCVVGSRAWCGATGG